MSFYSIFCLKMWLHSPVLYPAPLIPPGISGIQAESRRLVGIGRNPSGFPPHSEQKSTKNSNSDSYPFQVIPGHSRWNPSKVRVKKRCFFNPRIGLIPGIFQVHSRSIPGIFQAHSTITINKYMLYVSWKWSTTITNKCYMFLGSEVQQQ
jgi:hypothetical protein